MVQIGLCDVTPLAMPQGGVEHVERDGLGIGDKKLENGFA